LAVHFTEEVIMENDKQVTSSHISIPEGYYALNREERRAFLRSILSGMSPNESVRNSASKTEDETNTD
jgi:hypothetical protein